jgi:hypothetical protein
MKDEEELIKILGEEAIMCRSNDEKFKIVVMESDFKMKNQGTSTSNPEKRIKSKEDIKLSYTNIAQEYLM